jgi:hypothetical protein
LPYTKLKLNSERLAQHTVTIRHYTEDTGFACQGQSKPDDPTKGEPEYPTPLPITPDGTFPGGLAPPTDPYPGADPFDFEGSPAGEPKTVYIGVRGFATSGAQNEPGQCLQDVVLNLNHEIPNFGSPPYTVELSSERASVCTNGYFRGYYILDSQGNRSELLSNGGGFNAVEIIVFSYQPFPEV